MDRQGLNSDMRVTLRDVLKLALPLKSTVIGSPNQRGRIINWLVVLTDWQSIRDQVQLGDLVVIPHTLQTSATEKEMKDYFRTFSSQNVGGVLLFSEIPEALQTLAHNIDLPLVILPADSSMRDIQQDVASLLLDRQAQVTERGMQLYRQLSEMSREDKGLEAMTEMMSQVTGKIVVVQDKRLDIQALSVPPDNTIDLAELTEALKEREQLPVILRNRKAAAKTRQSHWQQILPVGNVARLLTPIVSGDRARGYLSVVGDADELDMLDKLTTEHGAAACALEMAKAKAVSEAKKELRGDFLEGILAGTVSRSEIERLRTRLDHDTEQPHAVLTLAWNNPESPSLRHLETAVNWILSSHNRPALVHIYGGTNVCVFQALRTSDEDMSTVIELERRLREQLTVEFPTSTLVSGLAGPTNALADWPDAYGRALQAMKLGQRLKLNRLVEYDSLGVYQLLTQLDDIPAVQEFCEKVIGPLADYDRRHRSNLVDTMDAYFKHHGNISQTAESLFIHRNTLLYRLERIEDLTGHEMRSSDMRLSLHLALKLWLLRPDTGSSNA